MILTVEIPASPEQLPAGIDQPGHVKVHLEGMDEARMAEVVAWDNSGRHLRVALEVPFDRAVILGERLPARRMRTYEQLPDRDLRERAVAVKREDYYRTQGMAFEPELASEYQALLGELVARGFLPHVPFRFSLARPMPLGAGRAALPAAAGAHRTAPPGPQGPRRPRRERRQQRALPGRSQGTPWMGLLRRTAWSPRPPWRRRGASESAAAAGCLPAWTPSNWRPTRASGVQRRWHVDAAPPVTAMRSAAAGSGPGTATRGSSWTEASPREGLIEAFLAPGASDEELEALQGWLQEVEGTPDYK